MQIDRRLLIGSSLSLLALPPKAVLASPWPKIEGVTTWSESVMVLYFDEEARNGFSYRLSRYPDLKTSWVWCMAMVDGHIYAYADQFLPSTAEHERPDTATADYGVPGLDAHFIRNGTSQNMTSLSFSAHVNAHDGGKGVNGPGAIPLKLDGIFHPGPLRAGSPAGRFERTGKVDATISVAGRTISLSGVAKAHEQTQENPRFGPSFTYAMLWSADASLTGLFAGKRHYGDFDAGGTDRAITDFRIEKWSPERRFRATLDDGTQIDGIAHAVADIDVPVFDRVWNGHIVRAEAAGHRMVGMINDWKPEDQHYNLNAG